MRRVALLLVPLFLFACDREPIAPDIAPSFDAANAPPVESGVVVRFDTPIGLSLADPEADLWAFIGLDIYDWCDDFSYTPDVVVAQEKKLMVNFMDRTVALAKGSGLRTSVWQRSEIVGVNWVERCAKIAATEPLATGLAKALYTDNSAVGYEYLTNANPYGWRYHGNLVGADGTNAILNGHHLWMWDQENNAQVLRDRKMSLH